MSDFGASSLMAAIFSKFIGPSVGLFFYLFIRPGAGLRTGVLDLWNGAGAMLS